MSHDLKFPTGWLSTDSVHYTACPRCGAQPGAPCVTPSGRPARGLTGGAHGARMTALTVERPDIAKLAKIVLSGLAEIVLSGEEATGVE